MIVPPSSEFKRVNEGNIQKTSFSHPAVIEICRFSEKILLKVLLRNGKFHCWTREEGSILDVAFVDPF